MIVNPRILRGGHHAGRPGPPPISPLWFIVPMLLGLIFAFPLLFLGLWLFPVR